MSAVQKIDEMHLETIFLDTIERCGKTEWVLFEALHLAVNPTAHYMRKEIKPSHALAST